MSDRVQLVWQTAKIGKMHGHHCLPSLKGAALKLNMLLVIFLMGICTSAYAAPVIHYTDITSGPNSGGENNNGCYLTINGVNFGASREASTVTVGGGEVAEYKKWTDTEISVQLGSAANDGDVTVVTAEGSATAPDPFDVRLGGLYFISTAGADSGMVCSFDAPCRTANYVEQLADFGAGDFLVVRGGTYDLSSGNENLSMYDAWFNVTQNRFYTASTPLVVYGYPGETATIDWGSLAGSTKGLRCQWAAEHGVFSNLTFDLADSGGMAMHMGFYSASDAYYDYLRLINITVRGGMAGATSGVNVMSLMRTDNLKMYGLDIGHQSEQADPGLQSHMIYLSHRYTNADIGWCHVHDNPYGRAAFQLAGDGWGERPFIQGDEWGMNSNVTIHHCRFENLPEAAVLFAWGCYGPMYFYNNLVYNANTRKLAGFSPIAVRGAEDTIGEVGIYHFFNNTIYTDAEDLNPGGIFQFGYGNAGMYYEPEEIHLHNNVVQAIDPTTNYYQNTNRNHFSLDQITASHNLWYGSAEPTPSFAASAQTTDALLATPGSDFRLQSGSPARGNGTAITAYSNLPFYNYDLESKRINTLSPDIGAYQYAEATPGPDPDPDPDPEPGTSSSDSSSGCLIDTLEAWRK